MPDPGQVRFVRNIPVPSLDFRFQFSPLWPALDGRQREAVLVALHAALEARGGVLPVPSPALIGTGRKPAG